jgi:ligand-binding sensor domain-containing protein
LFKILCGADGKIWMTSNQGVVVFDGVKFQHYTTEQGLATNVIGQIAEDNEGHIWLASYGGLHRLNPKGLTTFDEADGLERNRIHSIYEDRNGDLNVVSGNFNVSRLDSAGSFQRARPQLPSGSLWVWSSNAAFLDSRGDWWINTSEGVYRYANVPRAEDLNGKQPTEIYNESKGLLSDNNVRVFEDSRGDMWFAPWVTSKNYGLSRWQRSTGKIQNFTTADGLPEKPVASAFAEDATGNLWFGFTTSGTGVARFRDGRFTIINDQNILKAGITDIYRDRSNRLWIATNSEGLFRTDAPEADEPTFRRYRISDGLASDNVRCITEDLYGNIYVGTVRGVNRLSPETGRVKYYGTGDGLASDFINMAYRDRQGAIWFGTFNGLSKFVPEPDAPLEPPPILISGLRIAGEDYSVSPLGQREVFVPEQAANRNNLQIDFLSINNGGNAPARYQYRLEGAGDGWSEPTAESSVTFANLSSGAYRFLVRAVNADDAMSEQPAVVSFTVLRPFWQRWWFLLLTALWTAGAIYMFYRHRVAQLLKLERVRTRIATDLHDDIGSSLSKIAILSEVVRRKNGDPTNGATDKNEPLEIIANTSREMVDSMSDIVWAINPERDSLSDLIQRMRRFA